MQRTIPGVGVGKASRNLPRHGAISRLLFIAVLPLAIWPSLACALGCNVGTNVNSFQNFDAAEQEKIVQQLVASGVRSVRTSLRPDDKNIHLAKELQEKGIGLVLVPGAEFLPNAPLRPSTATSSDADQSRTRSVTEMRSYFQRLFQQRRLGAIFCYVWNEPDRSCIYRNGALLKAGKRATAPMPTR
jgi:hypothetical protein